MIDIEADVIDLVSTAVLASYATAIITSEDDATFVDVPLVSIVMFDSYTDDTTMTLDAGFDTASEVVVFFVNIYALTKIACKDIMKIVTSTMGGLNFKTTLNKPAPNLDRTIKRRQARFIARVTPGTVNQISKY